MNNELIEATARAIVGPHLPVPPNSRYTLEHLRKIRWDNATEAQRAEARMEARAALAVIAPAVLEEAATKATSFLVGDPKNGVSLHSPSPHQISDAIHALKARYV